ncbi:MULTISPECIES: hypothetical protein [Methylococcus]|uniref:Uncharacterized protein n=1 Tax=Methylococcus capsulatus TaxID=414 RepID=A0ABZ2F1A0_METCP|nr:MULTISPECIES: hypothetical protein [Methylococcus]
MALWFAVAERDFQRLGSVRRDLLREGFPAQPTGDKFDVRFEVPEQLAALGAGVRTGGWSGLSGQASSR